MGLKNRMTEKNSSSRTPSSSTISSKPPSQQQHTSKHDVAASSSSDDVMKSMCKAYEDKISVLEKRLVELASSPAIPSVAVQSPEDSVVLVSNDNNNDLSFNRSLDHRTPTPTRDFLASIGIDPTRTADSSCISFTTNTDLTSAAGMDKYFVKTGAHFPDEGFEDRSSIEDFINEDEKRVQQLEAKIESHIDEMKSTMTAAMEKFFV